MVREPGARANPASQEHSSFGEGAFGFRFPAEGHRRHGEATIAEASPQELRSPWPRLTVSCLTPQGAPRKNRLSPVRTARTQTRQASHHQAFEAKNAQDSTPTKNLTHPEQFPHTHGQRLP